ncbi:alpha-2-macroglobulin domain protein [Syntrophobacter fumaroxidans MPOB]|uniref:Alpha-2-macroglobulin domain protein n=2 Tax=Syntrophobacter TaxID=29526 RepID=A0LKF7_SYNFM|nr:alpha-2-macroglobulin domain protein [Syntrophobacter fumaroxidans MPOB]
MSTRPESVLSSVHGQRFRMTLFSACALMLLLLSTVLSPPFPVPGMAAETAGGKGGVELRVVRITPSGEDVPPGRQVVFEFDRAVVPLGRMERDPSEIPIGFEPALACKWRWLNPKTLACQLDEKAATLPATRYLCTVRPGIRAEDGATSSGELTHTFLTERPRVVDATVRTWLAPGTPQFGVRFNQPVRLASVKAHLYFRSESGERIPAVVSEETETYRYTNYRRGSAWILRPGKDLASGKDFDLMVEPGLAGTDGPEPGVEKRKIVSFQTFPPFRLIGVKCKTLAGKSVVVRPEDPPAGRPRCNPNEEISLLFTAPVLADKARDGLRFTPALPRGDEDTDPWDATSSYSRLSDPHKKNQAYDLQLPWLKPFTDYSLKGRPGGIADEFGRTLAKPVDLQLSTDHRPPDYVLYKSMPVLEKYLDTDAPALTTNINQIDLSYETLTTEGKTARQTAAVPVKKPLDSTAAVPLGIRRMLSGKPGVATGRLSTQPPVGGKETGDKWFFAQVTPYSVHVKLGHHNTLVWVTDLKTGKPVMGVDVQIYKDAYKVLTSSPRSLSRGKTKPDGTVELAGTATLDPDLKLSHSYKFDSPHLFVRCEKGEDLAVMPLVHDFRVDAEGANHDYIPSYQRVRHGHLRAWGATAQGIYKAGDTVQYKIYVRDQDSHRFAPPPKDQYSLKVVDPVDKVVHEREGIVLSEFGAFDGEFAVPKTGAVGYYRFVLKPAFIEEDLEPLKVLVSDFTPAPFKVETELSGNLFGSGDAVKVSTRARMHAGGPYADADTRIMAYVQSRPFEPQNQAARGYQFDVQEGSEHHAPSTEMVHQAQKKLDNDGNLETEFKLAELAILYGRLNVESAVRDDRGKFVANKAAATYYGRDRYVGMLLDGWVLQEGKPAKAGFLVVDQNGSPVTGVPLHIKVEWEQTKGSRVKGAGNAYRTEYVTEWVETESRDAVSASAPGQFEFTPKRSGAYRITAAINDTRGRPHETSLRRWATGKGYVLWESVPGNLLNVSPEKTEVRVGETARFLVQNPFPGAQALITVERFGVLQSWVKTLARSTEVVEIPVLPDYLPGFYLSVLVTSPRVDKPLSPEGDDLGKPTFRMGYAKIDVKDQYKEITVKAKPEKEEYKPGDTVTVELEARPRNLRQGEAAPPVELAVTVLDEAVFDLLIQGRKAYDPYLGFFQEVDDLDLANYSLLMHLVGREKLEKKGASPGGGGGFDLGLRSVFKFVSYWNPSVPVDAEGKARIRFKVPDNLTGWRVLAMAVTPDDRMGLGDTTFRVNQSTEIRPALPNQVIAGDGFEAGFTVMNRTDAPRVIEVSIEASGPVELKDGAPPKIVLQITAEPFRRQSVRLPLKTTGPGEIVFSARAGDERDRDGLKQTLKVLPRQSRETVALYGSTEEGEVSRNVAFPENLRPEMSRLAVTLSPTALAGLDGAFAYMKQYPFSCWEQKLAVGVAAALYPQLKPHLGESFSWDESEALVGKTIALAVEYQAPNGGMTFYTPKNEYVSPYLSAFTALAFNWLRESGHEIPGAVEKKLHEYLQGLLRRNETPEFYSQAMASTVRAAALAVLAESGKLKAEDLDRYRDRVKEMSLFGKAMYLRALLRVPTARTPQREVLEAILAHADETGGKLLFTETLDSGFRCFLGSSMRDNSAVLSTFIAYQAANPAASGLGDMSARLMRAIVEQRKGRNHWQSTQDNLFAMKALADFARVYEKADPDMSVSAFLDATPLGTAEFRKSTDPPALLVRPLEAADPGRKAVVKLERKGTGRLYYTTALSYTPREPSRESVNAGIEVGREYSVERNGSWVLLKSPMEIKTGELVRIDLFVSVPAERFYVVVEDPLPGGLEPVDRQLATASTVDAAKGEAAVPEGSFLRRYSDWLEYGGSRWSFYHRELRHEAARFYSERLPAGRYHLSYTAQAIAPGEFVALPVRAEEMYDPDVFGKGLQETLIVRPGEKTD